MKNLPKLSALKQCDNMMASHAEKMYLRVLARVLESSLLRFPSNSDLKTLIGYFRSRRFDLFYEKACAVSPTEYSDRREYFALAQLSAIVKKYPWDPALVGLDPETEARKSFALAEHRCRRMNQKFLALRKHFSSTNALLERMRSFIAHVLGDFDLADVLKQCDFGPGANVGVSGQCTHIGRKIDGPLTGTPTALDIWRHSLGYNFHLLTSYCERREYPWGSVYCLSPSVTPVIVEYNKISFVPKTAKTFRSIAVEPVANSYLQKGLDLALRLRLKRIGIDLSDQSANQRFAQRGSAEWTSDESFCTLDLSSASDSISIGLCRAILPPDWFSYMDQIRSPSYLDNGKVVRYHKFCSMGNGFCFPLETLIFVSACFACGAGRPGLDFVVYGDDIIVRKPYYDSVVRCLREIGFLPNQKKSFSAGPFRESCGEDYWEGEAVRPFTLDFRLDSLSSYFKFLNLSRRNRYSYSFFLPVYRLLLDAIPDQFRFFRPFQGPADSAIDAFDEPIRYALSIPTPAYGWRRDLQCLRWIELVTDSISDKDEFSSEAHVYAGLRGANSAKPFTVRRCVRRRARFVAFA